MAGDTEVQTQFTAGEQKLLLSILSHLEGDIAKTDWQAVAADCGYKDITVAKQRWGQIKRKKIMNNTGPTKVAKKQSVKVAETLDTVDGAEAGNSSSSGKKRGRQVKKAKIVNEDIDDDDAADMEF